MSERSSSFCRGWTRLFQQHLAKQRKLGVSDADIIRELQKECGISTSGVYRRIEHVDTCQQHRLNPSAITQTETRFFRKLSPKDQKRVVQSFHAKLRKAGGSKLPPKRQRKLWKKTVNKLNVVALAPIKKRTKKEGGQPQTTTKEETQMSHPGESQTKGNAISPSVGSPQLGEKAHLPFVPLESEEDLMIHRKSSSKNGSRVSETIDVSRSFPSSNCKCKSCSEEGCLALLLYRQRLKEELT